MSSRSGGYLRHGRGNLVMDIVVAGIRLNISSRTRNKKVFRQIVAMLRELSYRPDIIQTVRDRLISPTHLYQLYRQGQLNRVPTVEVLRPLWETMESWIRFAKASDKHRKDRTYQKEALKRIGGTILRDLPNVLSTYRKECEASGKAAMFNRTKALCQKFAKSELGRRHPVYQDLVDIDRLHEAPRRLPYLTPDDLRQKTGKLEQPYGAMVWSLALTGMNWTEYEGRWEVLPDRIVVHGTKREARYRAIPLVGTVIRPGCRYKAFREHVAEVGLKPGYMRKCFSRWSEEAGIPQARIRAYMGHSARDVTERYQDYDPATTPSNILVKDGEILSRYLGRAESLRVAK